MPLAAAVSGRAVGRLTLAASSSSSACVAARPHVSGVAARPVGRCSRPRAVRRIIRRADLRQAFGLQVRPNQLALGQQAADRAAAQRRDPAQDRVFLDLFNICNSTRVLRSPTSTTRDRPNRLVSISPISGPRACASARHTTLAQVSMVSGFSSVLSQNSPPQSSSLLSSEITSVLSEEEKSCDAAFWQLSSVLSRWAG